MEMLLILGRMLYNFDLSMPEEGSGPGKWEDQETYAVWVKSPLPVRLTAVS